MREKIVMIGAGSAVFTCGLLGDLLRKGWPAEVALVDIDPAALEVAERLARKMVTAKKADVTISAHTDRRKALPGATAVICTIGVGGRRAWEQDVFIPRKYGIFQPVGDTIMPGGTSRAMRMIPVMIAVARDVLDLCPEALFFNYSNPMAAICRAVRKYTPAKMVGLCHGITEAAHFLAQMLEVPFAELEYTAVGLNHLTWITHIHRGGTDLTGCLFEACRSRLSAPMSEGALGELFLARGSWEALPGEEPPRHPATLELTLQFGAFPAPMDRHITEFFPFMFSREHGYYGKTLGTEAFSFERTIAKGDNEFEAMREEAHSSGPLSAHYFERFSGEHEQVMDIIESIRTGNGRIYSANAPNTGQAPNLPPDVVLECPCRATAAGMEPVTTSPLPTGAAGVIAQRLAWVEILAEAAAESSREKFIQALILDGAVKSADEAARMADDFISAQRDYLPGIG